MLGEYTAVMSVYAGLTDYMIGHFGSNPPIATIGNFLPLANFM